MDTVASRSNDQFRPGTPHARTRAAYARTSAAYARDLDEITRLVVDGVTTPSARTSQQTGTALFWLESPAPSWNRIVRSPADPDDSAHAVEGSAAAAILRHFPGTDEPPSGAGSYTHAPEDPSTGANQVIRPYDGPSRAAD